MKAWLCRHTIDRLPSPQRRNKNKLCHVGNKPLFGLTVLNVVGVYLICIYCLESIFHVISS